MLRPERAGGANSAPPDLRVGFWGEEGKGRERKGQRGTTGKGSEREKEGEKEKGIKGREGGGTENETKDEKGRGREREDLCAVVIFPCWENQLTSRFSRFCTDQPFAKHTRGTCDLKTEN